MFLCVLVCSAFRNVCAMCVTLSIWVKYTSSSVDWFHGCVKIGYRLICAQIRCMLLIEKSPPWNWLDHGMPVGNGFESNCVHQIETRCILRIGRLCGLTRWPSCSKPEINENHFCLPLNCCVVASSILIGCVNKLFSFIWICCFFLHLLY